MTISRIYSHNFLLGLLEPYNKVFLLSQWDQASCIAVQSRNQLAWQTFCCCSALCFQFWGHDALLGVHASNWELGGFAWWYWPLLLHYTSLKVSLLDLLAHRQEVQWQDEWICDLDIFRVARVYLDGLLIVIFEVPISTLLHLSLTILWYFDWWI